MRTATVADLRNHFPRIFTWVMNGETVQITKRGRNVMQVVPQNHMQKKEKVVWPDFRKVQKEIWGNRVFSKQEAEEMEKLAFGERNLW